MRKKINIGLLLVLALSLLLQPAWSEPSSAPISQRHAPIKPQHTQVAGQVQKDRIVVKFNEGTTVRLRGKQLKSLAGADLAAFNTLLQNYPGTTVQRLFSRPEPDLEQEKDDAEQRSGWQLADLNLYYMIQLPSALSVAEVEALINALNALDVVEIAYPNSIDTLPFADIPPTTPDFQSLQGYLVAPTPFGYPQPSPAIMEGIDAFYAWTFPGGDGADTKFIDVEYGWNLTHEDFKAPFFQTGGNDGGYHGTAVLGIIIGQHDGFGVTGIAPAADFGVASAYPAYDYSAKINEATAALAPGDVILIELSTLGPTANNTLATWGCEYPDNVPEEWRPDVFDAIRTATAKGIVVVEGAGNGVVNLDDPAFNGYFDRSLRDSGAILVAAGEVQLNAQTGQYVYTRNAACFTNYGSRVDVNAWGGGVVTTGSGDMFKGDPTSPDPNQYYTQSFGGTSSASAIVAGAVLSLQGYMKQLLGAKLDPLAIRTLLTQTGTPKSFSESRQIGRMPNLKVAYNRLQLNPPPTISGFMPTAAYAGATVTISGTSLNSASQVTFNDIAASFTVLSATQINATVPGSATTGYIKVTTPSGTATSSQIFTLGFPPTISSFTPTSGPAGALVTITGTNFTTTTSVSFNGVAAQFTVVSTTQIQAAAPIGAGSGPIRVTNPDGMATSTQSFTVYPPPVISSFAPTNGPVGTSVSVNGSNFCAGACNLTQIKLNGTLITPSSLFPGVILFTIPSGVTSGKFTVTTPAGTVTSKGAFYLPPAIFYFTPAIAAVGTSVSIYGSNFCYSKCGYYNPANNETQVTLNGVSITPTMVFPGFIEFTLPAGATSGKFTITTSGGTITSTGWFNVQGPPTIDYFNPPSGPVGTLVTMGGSYFCGVPCSIMPEVKLNSTPVNLWTVFPGYMQFTIPVGATTGKFTVTTPVGTKTSGGTFTVTP
ncbi:hypothetical protein SCL_1590 [Sulfuricaulis limicola]|uniref:IPT/TIG domain-containing protein n=1 Tax=Sulfuricaulis limicola TaxID=1620215 RepID=A0A1B4XGH1_9GAMM|nr:IPT/TIG domain-containing protein [Sulfuricaulis limicola]BAV33895.1 hypothetical protein SCL_1590 [Sulfuricaulis limicola]